MTFSCCYADGQLPKKTRPFRWQGRWVCLSLVEQGCHERSDDEEHQGTRVPSQCRAAVAKSINGTERLF